MLKSLYVCATTAALALSASNGHAMSINIGAGVKPALDATDVIQKAAVYVVDGRPYCFYFDGWHGAGWYRCGFAHRRNLGWGGVYGWQGWSYGPAEKRYGQRGTTTVREGTTVRSRSTVRERTEGSSRNAGSNTTIRRSTTGSGSQGGGEIKGGAAPTGGRNVQGGAQGGTKAHDGGGKAEGGGQGGGGEKQ
jgi:hypothetical protein